MHSHVYVAMPISLNTSCFLLLLSIPSLLLHSEICEIITSFVIRLCRYLVGNKYITPRLKYEFRLDFVLVHMWSCLFVSDNWTRKFSCYVLDCSVAFLRPRATARNINKRRELHFISFVYNSRNLWHRHPSVRYKTIEKTSICLKHTADPSSLAARSWPKKKKLN
jgi:hypothetical protein